MIEALNGRFDDHHADLAQLLLDQIDVCIDKIDRLTARIEQLVATLPDLPSHSDNTTPPLPRAVPIDHDPQARRSTTVERLDEVPGIAERAAQIIIAEIGLEMAQFPTPAHLVSWAKLSPQTIQSGPRTKTGKTGKGTATPKVSSAKSPPLPPEPTRSSENATDASCADEASNEPTPARQRRLIDNSKPWDSTSPSHPQQPDNPLAAGTSGSPPDYRGVPPRTTTGQPRATPRNSQLRRLAASRGCRLDAGRSKGRDLPARRRRSGTESGRSPPDGGQRWPDRPGATDPPTRPAHR